MTDTDKLDELSKAATQGEWGQFNVFAGPWQDQAKGMKSDDYWKFADTSHDVSAMQGDLPYRVASFRHADTAAYVEFLVNLHRSGDLIPRATAEAEIQAAVEAEREACAVIVDSANMLRWTNANRNRLSTAIRARGGQT